MPLDIQHKVSNFSLLFCFYSPHFRIIQVYAYNLISQLDSKNPTFIADSKQSANRLLSISCFITFIDYI